MEKPSAMTDRDWRYYQENVNLLRFNLPRMGEFLLTVKEKEWYKLFGYANMEAWAKATFPHVKPDAFRLMWWREKQKKLRSANPPAPDRNGEPDSPIGTKLEKKQAFQDETPDSLSLEHLQKNFDKSKLQVDSKKKDDLPTDPTGRKIPKELFPLLNCQSVLDRTARQFTDLRRQIADAMAQAASPFDQLHNDLLPNIDQVAFTLRSAKRIYLCPWCQGRCRVLASECLHCRNYGLITKDYYQNNVPTEMKAANEIARLPARLS